MLDEYRIVFKFSNGFKSYVTSEKVLEGYISGDPIRSESIAIEIAKNHIGEYNSCSQNTEKIVGYTIEHRQVTEWKEV